MKPDANRIKRVWERASLYIVFIAVFVAVLGVAYAVEQQHENHTLLEKSIASSNAHHDETAKQNAVIITQNRQIKALLMQHSNDLAFTTTLLKELAQAGKDESALALYLIASQDAVCKATGATCPVSP